MSSQEILISGRPKKAFVLTLDASVVSEAFIFGAKEAGICLPAKPLIRLHILPTYFWPIAIPLMVRIRETRHALVAKLREFRLVWKTPHNRKWVDLGPLWSIHTPKIRCII